jgi:hypothetical protein
MCVCVCVYTFWVTVTASFKNWHKSEFINCIEQNNQHQMYDQ